MNEKFDVTGMSCSACSSHVEKSVSKLEGIKTVSVNLLTNSMQVEYDETKLDTGKIIEAVEHAGYGASVKEDGKAKSKGGGDGGCRFHPAEEYQKHEDKTDHIRDISDTAHVCVDGTYDLQRAWRSDAAAYHEVFPWK